MVVRGGLQAHFLRELLGAGVDIEVIGAGAGNGAAEVGIISPGIERHQRTIKHAVIRLIGAVVLLIGPGHRCAVGNVVKSVLQPGGAHLLRKGRQPHL